MRIRFRQSSTRCILLFSIGLLFDLQPDEIEDAITDNSYLVPSGQGGDDRGIDAIYIDDQSDVPIVHLLTCKYTTVFDKTSNFLPGGEVDKIINFTLAIMQQDTAIKSEVNPVLYSKLEEIWDLFQSHNPLFVFHICANHYSGFEPTRAERLDRDIHQHFNTQIKYHLMPDWVNLLTREGLQTVDARVKAIDDNFFLKADGDIRALIVNIDARDLIRIVLNDQEIRHKTDLEDYSVLNSYEILDDAFEANVRVYFKQRSKINREIKATVLSDQRSRFFYYNNGITIVCTHFAFPHTVRAPIISLNNLQIVNGLQTIRSLHEAFQEDPQSLIGVDILCRIYETLDENLSLRIAEYTNSQNPVTNRDIRALDYTQQVLEADFRALGYFYERKKNQYEGEPRHLRIDAEKAAQVLVAFLNKRPWISRSEKRRLFADLFDEVFNDSLTADKILLAYKLFEFVEEQKLARKSEIVQLEAEDYERESFILYTSYYILYIMQELANSYGLDLKYQNLGKIQDLYDESISILRQLIELGQETLSAKEGGYTHARFFKYSQPLNLFELHFLKNESNNN